MAGLKSLGSESAKKAGTISPFFRKLFFGRSTSTGKSDKGDDDDSASNEGQNSRSDAGGREGAADAGQAAGKELASNTEGTKHAEQTAGDSDALLETERATTTTGTDSGRRVSQVCEDCEVHSPAHDNSLDDATERNPTMNIAAPRTNDAPGSSASSKMSQSNMLPTQSQLRHERFERDKENQPPADESLVTATEKLSLKPDHLEDSEGTKFEAVAIAQQNQEIDEEIDPKLKAEREQHLKFIGEALDMARLALRTNETPVGCVFVHDGRIIARGMNATNVTRNGTRHAEFMALAALLSHAPAHGPKTTSLKPKIETKVSDADSEVTSVDSRQPDEGNEDGSKGHLYPYGQKIITDQHVDRNILSECVLYVTVEPCVMCASLLRQLKIKKVYFGAVNDKFGGTGGVFSIHANSLPIKDDEQTASAHPMPKPVVLPDGNVMLGTSFPPGGGDGGNVEPGYEIEGGWGRDDAVGLLRRFYVQENGRAPVPRKKEGRAARLAAMMEKDGSESVNSNAVDPASTTGAEGEDGERDTPDEPAVVQSDSATPPDFSHQ